jgi:hypothetical protein
MLTLAAANYLRGVEASKKKSFVLRFLAFGDVAVGCSPIFAWKLTLLLSSATGYSGSGCKAVRHFDSTNVEA